MGDVASESDELKEEGEQSPTCCISVSIRRAITLVAVVNAGKPIARRTSIRIEDSLSNGTLFKPLIKRASATVTCDGNRPKTLGCGSSSNSFTADFWSRFLSLTTRRFIADVTAGDLLLLDALLSQQQCPLTTTLRNELTVLCTDSVIFIISVYLTVLQYVCTCSIPKSL